MKNILSLLGITALLSSCGAGVSSNAQLVIDRSSVSLQSDYTVDKANVPSNYQQFIGSSTYSGPVICDDRATPMRLSFGYFGDIHSVDVLLEGSAGQKNTSMTNIRSTDSGSNISISFQTPATSVPLSVEKTHLTSQAIVVVPTANVIGATRVVMVAKTSTGSRTGELLTNYIPVVDNCPS
ncbi:hypothetical protein [Deinococcus peraridilitoris]|uniref:Uncharacterized protein n=1 Tax=Deinococcus peraridilitoris (strain DSM 19664 / LMG 22246 / CIP 109416 / KR-200) TaxID=937777 RepID=L0A7G7_DEIPD|nr:hypothetical protein [Deinococcus peraridilitoris]AFZ69102.1 hypothetical protein Deipe_3676 [Deinococcus peraridilitoris DSM 19664]